MEGALLAAERAATAVLDDSRSGTPGKI